MKKRKEAFLYGLEYNEVINMTRREIEEL